MKNRNIIVILVIIIAGLLLFISYKYLWTGAEQPKLEKGVTPASTEDGNADLLPKASVDEAAVETLRKSLNFVGALQSFSADVRGSVEDLNSDGHRVDYEFTSSVIVKRPNKLRTERHSKLYNQVFYYDGNTFTLYNPVQKVYASEAAPNNIEDMFHQVRDKYNLSSPLSDLIYSNSFDLLIANVNYAKLIGEELVGNVNCYHLIFGCPGADFQIWIAVDGDPLPYKYVVTDTSTPQLLAISTNIHNWNLAPISSDKTFQYTPLEGTFKIDLLEAK
jgi:hypothetical protein